MNPLYNTQFKISIILPCLNEEKAIDTCLNSIKSVIQNNALDAEVIIVDNNSTDQSVNKVQSHMNTFLNLKLVTATIPGYGSTLREGIAHASGCFIFMADCDNTYDFGELPLFISKLEEGYDMVIGNRFAGGMEIGAMPVHKKYLGNPFLSFITRLFFGIRIHDIHCGARAFRREIYTNLSLYTSGMEFASEMIIKATKRNIKIDEVPIIYRKRIGESKLEALGDGWRHVRFILLYSPLILFLVPGILLFFTGTVLMGIFYFKNPIILDIKLFFHPMFLFSTMVITGYQIIFFSMFSKIYAITHLGDNDKNFEKLFRFFTIEKAGLIGSALALIGALVYGKIFYDWIKEGFESLNQVKNSIVALTFLTIGIQTFFSAFMLSTLGIKEK